VSERTIVITGGSGFVGRYLLDELRRAAPHNQLIVWDRDIKGLPAFARGAVVDLAEPTTYRSYLTEFSPDWIIHLAALSSVAESFTDPQLTQRVNVDATRMLLEAVVETGVPTRVLAISSADIYGQGFETPVAELPLSHAIPKSPYATSKWEMEKMIEESFADRVVRVRPFAHIGPGQRLGFVTSDFASQIAVIEKGQQEPVIKVGNTSVQRDFTDVRDTVRAYRLLLEVGQMGEVYHVASGKAVSIQHVLDTLLSLAHVPIRVQTDPKKVRPVDVPILVGDASKLTKACGWRATIPLEQTLSDILDYWRTQPAGR
jgi:GDP-4-dehydro-6-deoxy-D-mannose reductase